MTDKKFNAILAKNDIAREIRNRRIYGGNLSENVIIEALKDIEKCLGEANQPCVEDIVNDTEKGWL